MNVPADAHLEIGCPETRSAAGIYVLPLDDPGATLDVAGGKGASLARLARAGLPVPGGFHVTTAAYRRFVAANNLQPQIRAALNAVDPAQPASVETAARAIHDLFLHAPVPQDVADAVAQAHAALPDQQAVDAVRSSATAEDLPGLSFAGQQDTFLNVHGRDAILAAVLRCWASLWTARAISYRAQHAVDHDAVALAVVVQALVHADAAGILFTANPVTGARDQALVNAAWGLGEAVVGGLVTPDTLTVDKAGGRVLARETADKQVMTVRLEQGTAEQPVPEARRQAPVLDDAQAAELVALGARIEQLYGMPMDIEWALAEGRFAILQARPITALPEPEAPAPTEWKPPHPKGQYLRASIVELLPDPLTPLYGTLGLAAINAGTVQLLAELAGGTKVALRESVVTINGYAYYSARFPPGLMLRMVIGMPFAMVDKMRHAESLWRDGARRRYVETIERWRTVHFDVAPAAEILTGVCELVKASFGIYAVYQSAVFPNANLSEMLFTRVYDRMIKRPGDPPAVTYLLGFDSTPILADKSLYDVAEWCRGRPTLAAYVSHTPARELASHLSRDRAPAGLQADDWREWQQRCQTHLEKYGCAIYSLDFAKPVATDDPASLLETCKLFTGGKAANPHERQRAASERREQATQAMLQRLKGLRLKLFRRLVTWAQRSAPLREDTLADIGLGYPLLRRMLLELGQRITQAGAIEQPEDIFWLVQAEVQRATAMLDRGEVPSRTIETVRQRKAEWRAEKRTTPPPVIPAGSKWMGLDAEMFTASQSGGASGEGIKGFGACSGRVTAPARVLHGPEDFGNMQPGDVLVAAITTPAWTPLFAMAGAIVTDIGGPLSHSSIVAREYGIPAVLGTGVATRLIHSGQIITVDGDAGTVTLQ